MRVAGSLVTCGEVGAGHSLFPPPQVDAGASAQRIRAQEESIQSRKAAGEFETDQPADFYERLAGFRVSAERTRPFGCRRVIILYRKSFNRVAGRELRAIETATADPVTPGTIVALVGGALTGSNSTTVQHWTVPSAQLLESQSVCSHALSVLAHYSGTWWNPDPHRSAPPPMQWVKSNVCDCCGSTPAGGKVGDRCLVCHSGQLHEVKTQVQPREAAPRRTKRSKEPASPPLPPVRPSAPSRDRPPEPARSSRRDATRKAREALPLADAKAKPDPAPKQGCISQAVGLFTFIVLGIAIVNMIKSCV